MKRFVSQPDSRLINSQGDVVGDVRDGIQATFSDADLKELRSMADFNCRLYTSEQAMLKRAADEIDRLRTENNYMRRAIDSGVRND